MRGLALALVLGGCGADAASGEDEVPIDSSLVTLLADLHLADARAALTPDSVRATTRDSLRALALDAHDTETDRLDDRLDALGRDPALARATYAAVEDQLEAEGDGLLTP